MSSDNTNYPRSRNETANSYGKVLFSTSKRAHSRDLCLPFPCTRQRPSTFANEYLIRQLCRVTKSYASCRTRGYDGPGSGRFSNTFAYLFFCFSPPRLRQIRKHYWCAYAYGAAEQQMPCTISEANTAKKCDENITLREETN